MRIWLPAVFLVLASTPAGIGAGDALKLTVYPSFSFAPSNVRVHVRVEPSAENRALEIAADSGDFYRSSLMPLDGDKAPRMITIEFRSLPGGDYDIRGSVFDATGHERACVYGQATVMSTGAEH